MTTLAPMELVPISHVVASLANARNRVWRLEQRPVYRIDLDPPEPWMLAWLAGEPLPHRDPTTSAFLALAQGLAERGCPIQRARIVDDPPSPYQRALHEFHRSSVEHGEVHGYIPRSATVEHGFTEGDVGDWWLIDGELLMFHFEDDHSYTLERTTDPGRIRVAVAAWEVAWSLAMPWEFLPGA